MTQLSGNPTVFGLYTSNPFTPSLVQMYTTLQSPEHISLSWLLSFIELPTSSSESEQDEGPNSSDYMTMSVWGTLARAKGSSDTFRVDEH
jgi:hypothetical protein